MRGDWSPFALGPAFFAAFTAVIGKLGMAGIHADLATLSAPW